MQTANHNLPPIVLCVPLRPCMSHSVNKRRAVTKAASENGPIGSSEEAGFVTIDLALGERTSLDVARMRGRLAVGRAAGQTDRFATRTMSSSLSKDRCPAPGLTRTAERAPELALQEGVNHA
jgi:hypothetical protein